MATCPQRSRPCALASAEAPKPNACMRKLANTTNRTHQDSSRSVRLKCCMHLHRSAPSHVPVCDRTRAQ
eukprot:1771869-Prymnesium_polylepis.1